MPQGSLLGPLLFILDINDMSQGFQADVKMKHFAYDTIMYADIQTSDDQKTLIEHLQKLTS